MEMTDHQNKIEEILRELAELHARSARHLDELRALMAAAPSPTSGCAAVGGFAARITAPSPTHLPSRWFGMVGAATWDGRCSFGFSNDWPAAPIST